jgi:hypothetical protein
MATARWVGSEDRDEEKEKKEKREEARRGRIKWWKGPKGVRPGILELVCVRAPVQQQQGRAGPRRETSELARVDREEAEPTVPTSDDPDYPPFSTLRA